MASITFGINKNKSWNAGGDVSWALSPMAVFYVSYLHEDGKRETYQNTVPSNIIFHTQDFERHLHRRRQGYRHPREAVPQRDLHLQQGDVEVVKRTADRAVACSAPMPTFPDTHNTNQRVDASAKYMLDELHSQSRRWNAKPFVKARVIWERNDSNSWQNIDQQLGWAVNPGDTTVSRAVFLGISDPNYSVVVGMLSFGVKW